MDFRSAISLIAEGQDAYSVANAITKIKSRQLNENFINSVKKTIRRTARKTKETFNSTIGELRYHSGNALDDLKHHLKTHYTSRGRNPDGRYEVSVIRSPYHPDKAEREKLQVAQVDRGGHASGFGHNYSAYLFHKREHAQDFKKLMSTKGALMHPTIHDHDGIFGRSQIDEKARAKKIIDKNKGEHIWNWSQDDRDLFKHHAHGLGGVHEKEVRDHLVANGNPEYAEKHGVRNEVFKSRITGKIDARQHPYVSKKELYECKEEIEKVARSLNVIGVSHHKKATGHRHSVAAFKKGTGEADKFREQMTKAGYTTSLGKEHDGDDVVVVNHQ